MQHVPYPCRLLAVSSRSNVTATCSVWRGRASLSLSPQQYFRGLTYPSPSTALTPATPRVREG